MRRPGVLAHTTLAQVAIFLCDAVTVWALVRALGVDPAIEPVFASFMLSTLFRSLGVLPGGLGSFEAASIVTLKLAGVPTAIALSATLLFRVLSFWLPMLPGLWYAHRMTADARGSQG